MKTPQFKIKEIHKNGKTLYVIQEKFLFFYFHNNLLFHIFNDLAKGKFKFLKRLSLGEHQP